MGITMNKDTLSQRFYLGHTDDILCIALHPVKDLVATGQIGRKPSIHIWDAQQPSNTAISILEGEHTRGICACGFSGVNDGGKKLATIGMDDHRTMILWDWKRGEKLASTRVHKADVYGVMINPFDSEKMITIGDKLVRFWKQTGGAFTSNRATYGNVAKLDTMVSLAFGSSVEICFTGSLGGLIYCWKGNKLERVVQAHSGPCYAIHSLDRGFVTGGKDGVVNLWDQNFERNLRNYAIHSSSCTRGVLVTEKPAIRSVMLGHGKILVGTKCGDILELDKNGTFQVLAQGHGEGELWGLAVHPVDGSTFATCSDDKTIRIWSLATREMIRLAHMRQSMRCIAYSPDGSLLAVGYVDGKVAVLNSDNFDTIAELQHRQEEISDIKFSPGLNKYVAVASHDNFVDIYNVLTQKRCGICRGSSSYITHIDWDATGKVLVSNSGAKEVLYFEAPSGKRITLRQKDVDSVEWDTLTGVLGPNCEGIWPPRSDVTDVNAASVTSDRSLIATGDDFGLVKLFNYPCKGRFAKSRQYGAHSAHVTNVRWAVGDKFLISTGGADTAICIWALRGHTVGGHGATLISGGDSEESDVETDDAGGYDSDVNYEKELDYLSKIYAQNMRQTEAAKKPHEQKQLENVAMTPREDKYGGEKSLVTVSPQSKYSRIYGLDLEYIFGYRANDCRQNVYFLYDTDANDRSQRVVYHAAGAGIVLDLSTGKQNFYLEHDDDIISLATNKHPKLANIVATGQIGNEPTIHVWDAANPNGPETVTILKAPHDKGVCSLDFSPSGKFLVSVGVDDLHTVVVWRWQEGSIFTKCDGGYTRIFRCEFRPDNETQLVSVGVRHLRFWQVAGTQMVPKRGVVVQKDRHSSTEKTRIPTMLSIAFGQAKSPPVLTYTGSMLGDIYVWREHQLVKIIAKAHKGPIFAMFSTQSDGFIVTGAKEPATSGENSVVKIWDSELNRSRPFSVQPLALSSNGDEINMKSVCVKSVSRIRGSILVGLACNEIWLLNEKSATGQPLMTGHGDGELWGLSVHPKEPTIFATASHDNSVRLWDVSKKTQVGRIQCPSGCQSCIISPNGRFIAVGLTNGQLLIVAIDTTKKQLRIAHKIRDRGNPLNDVKFSPDGSILAVGGADCCVDLYDVSDPQQLKRIVTCKGVQGEVTKVDFNEEGTVLRVSDGNYGHKYFTVPEGNVIKELTQPQTWHSWTSVVGQETVGFWASAALQASNSADVNCCCVSRNGTVVACGDDHGFVRLAAFPCSTPGARTKAYYGHSAHVTNVLFAIDDSRLFSAGGDDSCVFVWKCLGDK